MASEGYIAFHPNPSKPGLALPPGAVDTHCHVFGPGDRFPYSEKSSYIPVDAPKEVLFQRHSFLGIDRAVIVQASCHGSDNRAMIDALHHGGDKYRGIAIVDGDVTEEQLLNMHSAGVRGVRFNFVKRLKAIQPEADRKRILEKIAVLGWHLVVYFEPGDFPGIADHLASIQVPLVIDHMARITPDIGVDSEVFRGVARLMENPQVYMKVSCPERLSSQPQPYEDTDAVAREFIERFPRQVLWGTDWPHPNMKTHAPDDGFLVDRIDRICPDPDIRQKLLVTNPETLYWNNTSA